MRSIHNRYHHLCTAVATRLRRIQCDERGEINSSVAWTGAMLVLAVTIAGIVAAKAEVFAEGLDFGP